MSLKKFKKSIPKEIFDILLKKKIEKLRPSQEKAIDAGLFDDKNLLVCTPTASGKTLIAELAMLNSVIKKGKKAIYVVPLRALAQEKSKAFKKDYPELNIALSSGDIDSSDSYLEKYQIIITTSEKLDSLIRHNTPWIKNIGVVVFDEIHLLNDFSRGPTLEILITILRKVLSELQIIGLSATVGNPEEVSAWLNANLVIDKWRPVRLDKGVLLDGKIKFAD